MPNRHRPMRLSRDEELFLRHWMYDEARYQDGQGQAKRLQLENGARPADLAVLIAAAMPDPAEQLQAAQGAQPKGPAQWPWSEGSFALRLAEARRWLGLLSAEVPSLRA